MVDVRLLSNVDAVRMEGRFVPFVAKFQPTSCSQSALLVARIVVRIHVLKSQWAKRTYLCDVLTGLGPVEVWCIAGQDDYSARRICLQLIIIETISEADIKDAGDHCVHSIFGVRMWHQLHVVRHSNPDHVGALI